MNRWFRPRLLPFLALPFLAGLLSPKMVFARELSLTRDGLAFCPLVVITDGQQELLTDMAIDAIADTVTRWTGVELPVQRISGGSELLPEGPAVLLSTLAGLRQTAPDVIEAEPLLQRVAFLDEQGYVCVPLEAENGQQLWVVSRTSRGVYNGAVFLRDFLIDGEKKNLKLALTPCVRSPLMSARPVYTLTIWGNEDEYTAEDWEVMLDAFIRDGFDRVYFWLSGHFPSKKFPQAYLCADGEYDSTTDSRIASLQDQRRLIQAAHERGLKFYMGGALGGWVGTRFLTNLATETMKTRTSEGPYAGKYSLCPAHPKSRRALVDYYKEMYDALPEADGLYIESADEWGECGCELCQAKLDHHGSKMFGQYQLTLVQAMMREIWRDHPHARLCYTIGYGPHRNDVAYYEILGQMRDPRFEWMEARDSWVFPGPQGRLLPAPFFSRKIMRWQQYYKLPLETLVEDANRAVTSGMHGLIASFEPGFSTASYYTSIPFPHRLLPYVLTNFVHREATWEPYLNVGDMRERVQKRFFSRGASKGLGEDLWSLRELIRRVSTTRVTPDLQRQTFAWVDELEKRVAEARPEALPKTLETLDLMTRAIEDTRTYLGGRPEPKTDPSGASSSLVKRAAKSPVTIVMPDPDNL